MSVFVISDPHLSINTDKSMEVFGERWQSYTERLQSNWTRIVGSDDTVIIPGDISWALSLEEAIPDMIFLNSLPGRKIIGKGNHDFWWSTLTKIKAIFGQNNIDKIDILYNNAYEIENLLISGTRGWYNDDTHQPADNNADHDKIVKREAIRLKLSLDEAVRLRRGRDLPVVVFFHFPPVWNGFVCRELLDVIHDYDISRCYIGHIHGNYGIERSFIFENVRFELVSSDFLEFMPIPVII